MPFPLAALAILAAAQGASSAASSISASKATKSQEKLTREKLAQDKELALRELALRESEAGQFRDQRHQASTIGRLDMMEHGNFAPTYARPVSKYSGFAPAPPPSFYTPSPEMRSSAGLLKRDVMAGNTTPSQAVDGNRGQTGVLDLLSLIAQGGGQLSPGMAPMARPRQPMMRSRMRPIAPGGRV